VLQRVRAPGSRAEWWNRRGREGHRRAKWRNRRDREERSYSARSANDRRRVRTLSMSHRAWPPADTSSGSSSPVWR
jgi:hypothetical protein